jgi:hypothetical protein
MARTPGFGLGMDKPDQISLADILELVWLREYLSCKWTQLATTDEASNDGEGPSSLSENADQEKLALCSTASADMDCTCLSVMARCLAWVRLVHNLGFLPGI